MPEKKKPAVLKERELKAKTLDFSLQNEMLPLLQRVRGNKSKRTAKTLVKEGPLRVLVVALDTEGTLEEHKVDGPFSVQCLLGRAVVRLGSDKKELHTGDLLVVDAGVTHDVEALEPSVLLITITLGSTD
jgi:quercetin dioxygenase-like cupin family protein